MQKDKLTREARIFYAAQRAADVARKRARLYFSQRRAVHKLRGVPTSHVLGLDKE